MYTYTYIYIYIYICHSMYNFQHIIIVSTITEIVQLSLFLVYPSFLCMFSFRLCFIVCMFCCCYVSFNNTNNSCESLLPSLASAETLWSGCVFQVRPRQTSSQQNQYQASTTDIESADKQFSQQTHY